MENIIKFVILSMILMCWMQLIGGWFIGSSGGIWHNNWINNTIVSISSMIISFFVYKPNKNKLPFHYWLKPTISSKMN